MEGENQLLEVVLTTCASAMESEDGGRHACMASKHFYPRSHLAGLILLSLSQATTDNSAES